MIKRRMAPGMIPPRIARVEKIKVRLLGQYLARSSLIRTKNRDNRPTSHQPEGRKSIHDELLMACRAFRMATAGKRRVATPRKRGTFFSAGCCLGAAAICSSIGQTGGAYFFSKNSLARYQVRKAAM